MRILFANRPLNAWIGGDGVQYKETMEALRRRGIEVDRWEDMYRPPKQLKEYDLVQVFGLNFYWAKEAIRQCVFDGVPFIISAIFYPQVFDNSLDEMRDFVNYSKKTIALSEKEKKEMVDLLKVNENKVVVIPNGVNKTIFYNKNIKKDDYIVSIGRLQKQKGVDLLIKACKKGGFKLRYISSECRGVWAEEQKRQIDKYHQNISQTEVSELLNKSSVYVNPSLSERQSLGVLEACACGLPIVDSIFNRGADFLPSSLIVDPNDTDGLIEAINRQKGKKNNDAVLSWDDIALKLIKLYEDICYNANA